MADCPGETALVGRIARRKLDSVTLMRKDSDLTFAPCSPPRLAGCCFDFSPSSVNRYYDPSASVVFCFPLTAAEGWQAHLDFDKTHCLFGAFCRILVRSEGAPSILLLSILVLATGSYWFQSPLASPSGSRVEARLPS